MLYYISVFLAGAGIVAFIHFMIRVYFEGKRFLECQEPKFSKHLRRDGKPFPFSIPCPKCSVSVKVGPAATNEYCYCCRTQFLTWIDSDVSDIVQYHNIKYNVRDHEYIREVK
jgi:hypothetical protein